MKKWGIYVKLLAFMIVLVGVSISQATTNQLNLYYNGELINDGSFTFVEENPEVEICYTLKENFKHVKYSITKHLENGQTSYVSGLCIGINDNGVVRYAKTLELVRGEYAEMEIVGVLNSGTTAEIIKKYSFSIQATKEDIGENKTHIYTGEGTQATIAETEIITYPETSTQITTASGEVKIYTGEGSQATVPEAVIIARETCVEVNNIILDEIGNNIVEPNPSISLFEVKSHQVRRSGSIVENKIYPVAVTDTTITKAEYYLTTKAADGKETSSKAKNFTKNKKTGEYTAALKLANGKSAELTTITYFADGEKLEQKYDLTAKKITASFEVYNDVTKLKTGSSNKLDINQQLEIKVNPQEAVKMVQYVLNNETNKLNTVTKNENGQYFISLNLEENDAITLKVIVTLENTKEITKTYKATAVVAGNVGVSYADKLLKVASSTKVEPFTNMEVKFTPEQNFKTVTYVLEKKNSNGKWEDDGTVYELSKDEETGKYLVPIQVTLKEPVQLVVTGTLINDKVITQKYQFAAKKMDGAIGVYYNNKLLKEDSEEETFTKITENLNAEVKIASEENFSGNCTYTVERKVSGGKWEKEDTVYELKKDEESGKYFISLDIAHQEQIRISLKGTLKNGKQVKAKYVFKGNKTGSISVYYNNKLLKEDSEEETFTKVTENLDAEVKIVPEGNFYGNCIYTVERKAPGGKWINENKVYELKKDEVSGKYLISLDIAHKEQIRITIKGTLNTGKELKVKYVFEGNKTGSFDVYYNDNVLDKDSTTTVKAVSNLEVKLNHETNFKSLVYSLEKQNTKGTWESDGTEYEVKKDTTGKYVIPMTATINENIQLVVKGTLVNDKVITQKYKFIAVEMAGGMDVYYKGQVVSPYTQGVLMAAETVKVDTLAQLEIMLLPEENFKKVTYIIKDYSNFTEVESMLNIAGPIQINGANDSVQNEKEYILAKDLETGKYLIPLGELFNSMKTGRISLSLSAELMNGFVLKQSYGFTRDLEGSIEAYYGNEKLINGNSYVFTQTEEEKNAGDVATILNKTNDELLVKVIPSENFASVNVYSTVADRSGNHTYPATVSSCGNGEYFVKLNTTEISDLEVHVIAYLKNGETVKETYHFRKASQEYVPDEKYDSKPTIVATPENGSTVNAGSAVKLTIKDDDKIAEVRYHWEGKPEKSPTFDVETLNMSLKVGSEEGEYRLYVEAKDTLGNSTGEKVYTFYVAEENDEVPTLCFHEWDPKLVARDGHIIVCIHCGEERNEKHEFVEDKCVCGMEQGTNECEHEYVLTLTNQIKCKKCGHSMNELICLHDGWENEISCDHNFHWKKCPTCDQIFEKQRHTFENGVCSYCGMTRLNTCQYGLFMNAQEHWFGCLDCDAELGRQAHTFVNNVCSFCQYEK